MDFFRSFIGGDTSQPPAPKPAQQPTVPAQPVPSAQTGNQPVPPKPDAEGSPKAAKPAAKAATQPKPVPPVPSGGTRSRAGSATSSRAPSPPDPGELDLSHLSEEERAQIAAVMMRARGIQDDDTKQIRAKEVEYIGQAATLAREKQEREELQQQLQQHQLEQKQKQQKQQKASHLEEGRKLRETPPAQQKPSGAVKQCCVCSLELPGDKHSTCADCDLACCNKCGTHEALPRSKQQEWLCSVCLKKRQLVSMPGTWSHPPFGGAPDPAHSRGQGHPPDENKRLKSKRTNGELDDVPHERHGRPHHGERHDPRDRTEARERPHRDREERGDRLDRGERPDRGERGERRDSVDRRDRHCDMQGPHERHERERHGGERERRHSQGHGRHDRDRNERDRHDRDRHDRDRERHDRERHDRDRHSRHDRHDQDRPIRPRHSDPHDRDRHHRDSHERERDQERMDPERRHERQRRDLHDRERIEHEKQQRERIERERLEHDRMQKEKQEQERLEKERVEKERKEKERLEHERIKREQEKERQRLEQERIEKEKLEQERLKRLEMERLEKERLEKERLEKERLEKERLEKERLERERLEKERMEMEKRRLDQERLERERIEKERQEREKLERERLERERLERERLERERLERERLERERLEKERLEQLERERLAQLERERLERERLEQERLERERLERERIERERLERERLEREKVEQEKKERERQEKLRREREERERQERLERERLERERKEIEEHERREKARLEKEKREREEKKRLEQERIERERIQKERQEKLEREQLEKERMEKEQDEKERLEMERREMERFEKRRLEMERANQEFEEQMLRMQAARKGSKSPQPLPVNVEFKKEIQSEQQENTLPKSQSTPEHKPQAKPAEDTLKQIPDKEKISDESQKKAIPDQKKMEEKSYPKVTQQARQEHPEPFKQVIPISIKERSQIEQEKKEKSLSQRSQQAHPKTQPKPEILELDWPERPPDEPKHTQQVRFRNEDQSDSTDHLRVKQQGVIRQGSLPKELEDSRQEDEFRDNREIKQRRARTYEDRDELERTGEWTFGDISLYSPTEGDMDYDDDLDLLERQHIDRPQHLILRQHGSPEKRGSKRSMEDEHGRSIRIKDARESRGEAQILDEPAVKRKPSALDRVSLNEHDVGDRSLSPSRRSPRSPPRSPSWMRYRGSPPRSPPIRSMSPKSPTERFPASYAESNTPPGKDEIYAEHYMYDSDDIVPDGDNYFTYDSGHGGRQIDMSSAAEKPPPKPARISDQYEFHDEAQSGALLDPHALDLASYAATVASDTAHLTNLSVSPTNMARQHPNYLEISPDHDQESISPPSPNYYEDGDDMDVAEPTPKNIDYQNSKRQKVRPPQTDWSPITDLSPILDVSPSIEAAEQAQMFADQGLQIDDETTDDMIAQMYAEAQAKASKDPAQSPLRRSDKFEDISAIGQLGQAGRVPHEPEGLPSECHNIRTAREISDEASDRRQRQDAARRTDQWAAEVKADNMTDEEQWRPVDNRDRYIRADHDIHWDRPEAKDKQAKQDANRWERGVDKNAEQARREGSSWGKSDSKEKKTPPPTAAKTETARTVAARKAHRSPMEIKDDVKESTASGDRRPRRTLPDTTVDMTSKKTGPVRTSSREEEKLVAEGQGSPTSSDAKVKPHPIRFKDLEDSEEENLSPHYRVMVSPVSPGRSVPRREYDTSQYSPSCNAEEQAYLYPSPGTPPGGDFSPPNPQSPSYLARRRDSSLSAGTAASEEVSPVPSEVADLTEEVTVAELPIEPLPMVGESTSLPTTPPVLSPASSDNTTTPKVGDRGPVSLKYHSLLWRKYSFPQTPQLALIPYFGYFIQI